MFLEERLCGTHLSLEGSFPTGGASETMGSSKPTVNWVGGELCSVLGKIPWVRRCRLAFERTAKLLLHPLTGHLYARKFEKIFRKKNQNIGNGGTHVSRPSGSSCALPSHLDGGTTSGRWNIGASCSFCSTCHVRDARGIRLVSRLARGKW